MDQNSTIRTLIPADIIDAVPEVKKEHVKTRITQCFREAFPGLYEKIGASDEISEEMSTEIVSAIRSAAATARAFHEKMSRLHAGGFLGKK